MKITLSKVITYTTAAYFFLLPLFIVPQISPWIDFSKKIIGIAFALLLLLLWALQIAATRVIKFRYTFISLLVITISIFSLVSTLTASNPIAGLWTLAPLISAILLYLIILNNSSSTNLLPSLIALISSGLILSLLTLGQEAQTVITTSPQGSFLLNKAFSPVGGKIYQEIFLLALLPLALYLTNYFQKQNFKAFFAASFFIIVLGVIITGKHVIENPPLFLDWGTSWKVSLGSLTNNAKETLLGVGPQNYSYSYSRYRPMEQNLNKNLWNLRFDQGRSEILNTLANLGILGFLAIIIFHLKIVSLSLRQLSDKKLGQNTLPLLPVLFLIAFFYIFPFTSFVFLLFFPLLSLLTVFYTADDNTVMLIRENKGGEKEEIGEVANFAAAQGNNGYKLRILPTAVFFAVLIAVLTIGFFTVKVALAEHYFTKSQEFQAKNDVVNTFNSQRQAVIENPYEESYHLVFSRTNLAIAFLLAQNKNPSDQEKEILRNHVRLAIIEASNATSLNPQRYQNFENLADLYQALQSSLQGAEDWAINTFQTAITLDPTNPDLYLKRGGSYNFKKDQNSALRDYQTAVALKSDYPNAHYNLAILLQDTGNLDLAKQELEQVLLLLPQNSNDYKTVKKQLDDLVSKQATKSAGTAPSNLNVPNVPTPLPSVPIEKQQLNKQGLPKTVTPTPTAAPTAVPTPTLTPTP